MKVQPLLVHQARSYCGPTPLGANDLEERVLALEELDRFIRERADIPRREEEAYYAEIQPGVELWRALFEQHPCVPDHLRGILAGILGRSRGLSEKDSEGGPPLAGMGLWRTDAVFVERDVDWYKFRRNSLQECGVTETSLLEQASNIFPHLVFSSAFPECLGTLEGGFSHVLPAVIRALAALNDELLPAIDGYEIVEGLRRFSAVSGFEATMEGNVARNSVLTFSFGRGGATRKLVCAPHMKISSSEVAGDSRHYYNRIYFNAHQADGGRPQIYVGHVGGHL